MCLHSYRVKAERGPLAAFLFPASVVVFLQQMDSDGSDLESVASPRSLASIGFPARLMDALLSVC